MDDANFETMVLELDTTLLGDPVHCSLASTIGYTRHIFHFKAADAANRARDDDKLPLTLRGAPRQQRPTSLEESEWTYGIDLKIIAEVFGCSFLD